MTTPAATISARVDGFRRCGVAHPDRPVPYRAGYWTAAQLALLRAEPNLVVVDGDGMAVEPDRPENPLLPGGALAHLTPTHLARLAELDREWIDRVIAVAAILGPEQVDRLVDLESDGVQALLEPRPVLDAALDVLRTAPADEVQAFLGNVLADPEIAAKDGRRAASLEDVADAALEVLREAPADAVRAFLQRVADDPGIAPKIEAEAETGQPEAGQPAGEFARAIAAMEDGDFGKDGRPSVKALERITGRDWTAAERDARWEERQTAARENRAS